MVLLNTNAMSAGVTAKRAELIEHTLNLLRETCKVNEVGCCNRSKTVSGHNFLAASLQRPK